MALDDADKKLIGELIAAALKPEALAPALAPAIKAHVGEATKGALTADDVAKLIAEATKGKGDAEGDKGKGKGKEDDPSAARIAALEASIAAERKARADTEAKATAERNLSAVRDALIAAGVPAERVHLAVPAVQASGVLVLDGDKPGWKGKDAYGVETVLPFADGAKAWAGTPDGKTFLPPVDVGGTGNSGGSRNGGRSTSDIKSVDDLRNLVGSIDLSALG